MPAGNRLVPQIIDRNALEDGHKNRDHGCRDGDGSEDPARDSVPLFGEDTQIDQEDDNLGEDYGCEVDYRDRDQEFGP